MSLFRRRSPTSIRSATASASPVPLLEPVVPLLIAVDEAQHGVSPDPCGPSASAIPVPANPESTPTLTPPKPSPSPTASPALHRRSSIFGMNITWGDPRAAAYAHAHAPPHGGPQTPTPPGHRKLRKKVSFAPGHTSVYAEDTVPLTPSPLSTPIQTPSSTPLKPKSSVGVGGGLRSAFRRLGVRNPSPPPLRPPSPSGSDHSDTSWHHHDRYFPEYEPLYPTTKPFTDPFQYALTHEEVRRQHHQAVLGQSVALHYPDLPSWSEYTGEKGKDKSKVGWQSGRWGTEGWTGYGWDGETLPTSEGLTFGAPMPKGVAIVPPDQAQGGGGGGGGGGGKKKKKGKGGGGGAGMLRRPAAGMEKEETREGEETKTRAKRGSARGPNIGAKHADNDSDLGECEEDMRRAV